MAAEAKGVGEGDVHLPLLRGVRDEIQARAFGVGAVTLSPASGQFRYALRRSFPEVFKLGGRQIAQAGMQPLLVVNHFQKVSYLRVGIGQAVVLAQTHVIIIAAHTNVSDFDITFSICSISYDQESACVRYFLQRQSAMTTSTTSHITEIDIVKLAPCLMNDSTSLKALKPHTLYASFSNELLSEKTSTAARP